MNTSMFSRVIHPCDVPLWDGKKWPMFCKITITDGRLSITGVIGPNKHGNARGSCGQIDMGFDHENKSQNDSRYDYPIKASELRFSAGWNRSKWYKFLDIWHTWHLNDTHSECEHQEQAGITYTSDPHNVCVVCGYKIGSAWTSRELPSDVVEFLESLPVSDRIPAWV
jgi:hypothetical protein